jgi:phosphoribosyl 1,2-cyclic phosphodiesterase
MSNGPPNSFKVIFVGTGVSTAVPNLLHILNDSCSVCRDAMNPSSRNKRNNVSIAIMFTADGPNNEKMDKCILIDCGKTMR